MGQGECKDVLFLYLLWLTTGAQRLWLGVELLILGLGKEYPRAAVLCSLGLAPSRSQQVPLPPAAEDWAVDWNLAYIVTEGTAGRGGGLQAS